MQLTRRKFLIVGSLLGFSPYLKADKTTTFEKAFKKVEKTIEAVQEHMFPKSSSFPSAMAMNATSYLFDTITHKSFDRDIKAFVLEGAEELASREKGQFVSMSSVDKEKALRAYEETNYGNSWLSRIMTITMEGILSDPIYGSNVKENGWKVLDTYGGFPRPKTKYLES